MWDSKSGRGLSILTVSVHLIATLAGCTGPGDFPGGSETGLFAALGLDESVLPSEAEENDSFASSSFLDLADARRKTVGGTVQSSTDVDVFDFGPVNAGDRLVVDVVGDGRLDAVAAVFDADTNLVYLNDDRDYFSKLVDPHIDFLFRRGTDRCYVAVASSPSANTRGDYRLEATLTPDVAQPTPVPQVVLLNFDGAASVEFAGRAPVDVPWFDADSVSDSLAGQTDLLAALILERVREDFVGLEVEVHSSREQSVEDTDLTIIHFGAYDRKLLGVAENIDEFNERTAQEAIVFTDTFTVFSILAPSIEEYAQAFANVASHEIGHLLGLVHTADTTGLMDITASLRQLMRNQAFSVSPLESFTMPLGFQDAVASLVDSVGGDPELARKQSTVQIREAKVLGPEHGPGATRLDRSRVLFSTCMCTNGGAANQKLVRQTGSHHTH